MEKSVLPANAATELLLIRDGRERLEREALVWGFWRDRLPQLLAAAPLPLATHERILNLMVFANEHAGFGPSGFKLIQQSFETVFLATFKDRPVLSPELVDKYRAVFFSLRGGGRPGGERHELVSGSMSKMAHGKQQQQQRDGNDRKDQQEQPQLDGKQQQDRNEQQQQPDGKDGMTDFDASTSPPCPPLLPARPAFTASYAPPAAGAKRSRSVSIGESMDLSETADTVRAPTEAIEALKQQELQVLQICSALAVGVVPYTASCAVSLKTLYAAVQQLAASLAQSQPDHTDSEAGQVGPGLMPLLASYQWALQPLTQIASLLEAVHDEVNPVLRKGRELMEACGQHLDGTWLELEAAAGDCETMAAVITSAKHSFQLLERCVKVQVEVVEPLIFICGMLHPAALRSSDLRQGPRGELARLGATVADFVTAAEAHVRLSRHLMAAVRARLSYELDSLSRCIAEATREQLAFCLDLVKRVEASGNFDAGQIQLLKSLIVASSQKFIVLPVDPTRLGNYLNTSDIGKEDRTCMGSPLRGATGADLPFFPSASHRPAQFDIEQEAAGAAAAVPPPPPLSPRTVQPEPPAPQQPPAQDNTVLRAVEEAAAAIEALPTQQQQQPQPPSQESTIDERTAAASVEQATSNVQRLIAHFLQLSVGPTEGFEPHLKKSRH